MRPITRNQFLVLVVLLRQPMHVYAIRQEVIELTGRRAWLSYSSVQRAIINLVKLGYIEGETMNTSYWLKARRGVPYEITDSGYWFARRELSMYHEVFIKARGWLERLDT